MLVNASRQGLVQDQGLYKNRGLGVAVSKVSGCRQRRAGPTTSTPAHRDSPHKSFRWRISQTIRFRKYGMCCCRDTETPFIFISLIPTQHSFPHIPFLLEVFNYSLSCIFGLSNFSFLITCDSFSFPLLFPIAISTAIFFFF